MPRLHTPTQNFFLAALPGADYERLRPSLELVSLPQGEAVYQSGGGLDLVYFPTTSLISLQAITDDGHVKSIALIGNEGVFSIALLMGRKTTLKCAIAQSGGYGYRLKTAHLMKEFELGSPLRYLLQQYTQKLIARIGQATTPKVRLARNRSRDPARRAVPHRAHFL